jgi:hypothetical protein
MESANRSQYMYDMWSEPNGSFGGMLLGDGYWVLVDSGFQAWTASNAYALDDVVVPNIVNGHKYRCTTDGTSDATEPSAWPTDSAGTVVDGTVTWTEDGATGWAVSYTGLGQEMPQWIASSAAECWMQMAHPQDHETDTALIQMSNGGVVKSFFDASAWGANWVQATGYWFNNQDQSQYDVGLADDWPSTTTMQPWHGYQFLVHEPNRAWIIP